MLYEIIGWFGAIAILIAYLLVSIKRISPTSKAYQMLNLLGALGIVVNSLVHNAIPSAGLNITWSVIALYGLINSLKRNE